MKPYLRNVQLRLLSKQVWLNILDWLNKAQRIVNPLWRSQVHCTKKQNYSEEDFLNEQLTESRRQNIKRILKRKEMNAIAIFRLLGMLLEKLNLLLYVIKRSMGSKPSPHNMPCCLFHCILESCGKSKSKASVPFKSRLNYPDLCNGTSSLVW